MGRLMTQALAVFGAVGVVGLLSWAFYKYAWKGVAAAVGSLIIFFLVTRGRAKSLPERTPAALPPRRVGPSIQSKAEKSLEELRAAKDEEVLWDWLDTHIEEKRTGLDETGGYDV